LLADETMTEEELELLMAEALDDTIGDEEENQLAAELKRDDALRQEFGEHLELDAALSTMNLQLRHCLPKEVLSLLDADLPPPPPVPWHLIIAVAASLVAILVSTGAGLFVSRAHGEINKLQQDVQREKSAREKAEQDLQMLRQARQLAHMDDYVRFDTGKVDDPQKALPLSVIGKKLHVGGVARAGNIQAITVTVTPGLQSGDGPYIEKRLIHGQNSDEPVAFSFDIDAPTDGIRRDVVVQLEPTPQALEADPQAMGAKRLTYDPIHVLCLPVGPVAYVPSGDKPEIIAVNIDPNNDSRAIVRVRTQTDGGFVTAAYSTGGLYVPSGEVVPVNKYNQDIEIGVPLSSDKMFNIKAYAYEGTDKAELLRAIRNGNEQMKGLHVSPARQLNR